MSEKFDFSTIKDQKKFDRLDPEAKDVIIGKAQSEAGKMAKMVKSGEAEDYPQAERKIEEIRSEKEEFEKQLESIKNRQLTVENIDDFAEKILNALVALVEEIREKYKKNHPKTKLELKELEDAASKEYGLPNIEELLEAAGGKVEQIKSIGDFIQKNIIQIDEVITRPAGGRLISGGGGFELPGVLPRLTTFIYILQADFGIDLEKDKISLKNGIIKKRMMRKLSYATVEVPALNRIVQICDEEGNASYIFDREEIEKAGFTADGLNRMSKNDKNSLIAKNSKIGKRLVQTKHWRDNMSALLAEIKPSKDEDTPEAPGRENLPRVSISELDPWRGFWTDEAGRHWGATYQIAIKIGRGERFLEKRLAGLTSRPVIGLNVNREVCDAYCYEDLLEKEGENINLPKVEETGEWRGFSADKNTGKHWGEVPSFVKKIHADFSEEERERLKLPKDYDSVESRLKGMETRGIINLSGKNNFAAYCYEDFIEKESKLLKVEAKGEWRGFWIDPKTGNHWGGISTIAKKIGKGYRVIAGRISGLETREITTLRGESNPNAYCFEEVEKIIEGGK